MERSNININDQASLIWSIADKLTGVYKPHEYGEVILPLTVLKRFDSVLKKTKDKVLAEASKHSIITPPIDFLLKSVADQPFYNTSKYDFKKLLDDPDNLEENLYRYINAFSKEVTDIMEKFKFENHIRTMANKGILYSVIEAFNSKKANLHPDEVSNIEMGYVFEEIIRRFSESHNEDAGQHYTPREVIDLMVKLMFEDENLQKSNKIIQIYDGTCGTGGMLSVSLEHIKSLNNSNEVFCHGQELNDQTYAICKADMLLKKQEAYIKDGNTLSDDKFASEKFDYIIMNPPFGREWKNEKAAVEAEAKKGYEGRFGAGLPAISDSQLLFLQNAVSKMKPEGSKIAIIHNGSALFSGDAGSGASEIRKYVIESDLLDCIVQLPNDIFYNTGITTYIWLLSNKKPKHRIGKVQLIDASNYFVRRKKNLGNKRNDISPNQIDEIVKIYSDFNNQTNKYSKIFNNNYFGYNKVTVEQPLLDDKGMTMLNKNGKPVSNKKLTDTENIPLNQNINEYMEIEVRPFAPNSYIDETKTKVGYEISFSKNFFEYKEPRNTQVIMSEILKIDNQLDDTLKELFNNEQL